MIRTSITIGGNRIYDTEFTSVSISQSVGGHHTFMISLKQDAARGVLMEKAESWIGQPVIIGVDNKKEEEIAFSTVTEIFKGVVTVMGLARRRGTAELMVRGESPTVILDDGPHTRSFTDKGLQEIVDEVMLPYKKVFPKPPETEPKNFTKPLDYCVQYKESNFTFLARLANRYGEWFYYDGLNMYFGKPPEEDAISLDFGEDSLNHFDISVAALPAKFEMRGYDYLKPKPNYSLSAEAPQSTKSSDLGTKVIDIAKQKLYTQVPSVSLQTAFEEGEFDNIVERREQINLDETVILSGFSRNPKLKIGAKIEVNDDVIGESYGEFIITDISHDIGQAGDYNNSFKAVPAEVTTPPLTAMPNPPFCEMQLAKVTNVADEGSLGRIKVKFLWQEDSEEESPWIRVASPYTGKNKGFYITPEVKDHVLVAFENNNPNKPYVLTGMYSEEAKPEWFDTKNRFKGFKSKGKNQWKFDDKNKSISISAPSTITMSAGDKINLKTGGGGDSEVNIEVGDGTVNISAKSVNVVAAEDVNVEAAEVINLISQDAANLHGASSANVNAGEVTVSSTDKTTVSSDTEVGVEGIKVGISGSAEVDISGAIVKINS